jgi:alpha-L-arabinofuranosidase
MAGRLNMSPHSRVTPFLKPHSIEIDGYHEILAGDYRFFNNLFMGDCSLNEDQENPQYEVRLNYGKEAFGLSAFDKAAFPVQADGNAYLNGTTPMKNEPGTLILTAGPEIQLEKWEDGLYLEWKMPEELVRMKNKPVNTRMLGSSKISGQDFVNPDHSPVIIDKDFLGKKRDSRNPACGPFEITGSGTQKIRIWEK